MNVTLSRLLELAESGVSADAFRLYLTASCWAFERGTRHMSCVVMANLPGAPRNPKALGRLITELMATGLVVSHGDGYEVPEKLSPAAERMRRVRANGTSTRDGPVQGTDSERVRETFNAQPANGTEGVSPAPLQTLDQGSGFSLQSSALSSSQGPVSKRARKAPKLPRPADFDAKIRPRVVAWAKGKGYPEWWISDRLEQMALDCGSKGITYSDWYLGAVGWLNREDKQYGNGPAALEARRQRNGKPPGLVRHEQHRAEEERAPAPYNHVWLDR